MSTQPIPRRAALRGLAASAAAVATLGTAQARVRRAATATRAQVRVRLSEPIGTIRPAFYGQFVEHLGGVVYDGVWVGPESKIANTGGMRQAVIDHMKPLGDLIIRWPGGCFADAYHWRDGIGPRAARPRRFGRWREQTEPNQFGTHEFVEFCRLCGAVPYLAGNVGSGTPEEFQNWVEYCNAPAGATTLADERVANGATEPLGVRYWGVGNESWGCGGNFTPEEYCREYRRFTTWMPRYGVPLFLIAAGPNGNDLDWTRRFFENWRRANRVELHGWAPHYYCGTTGHALNFSPDQWYEQLHKARYIETLIADQWAALGEFDPEHRIKLCVDEWGTWHPPGTGINPRHELEQMNTLRDALVAALSLDTFNRHAEKLEMANIAQLVNCLQSLFLADGDKFVATPNYHVFRMYVPHYNAQSLRLDIQAEDVTFKVKDRAETLYRLTGSASKGKDNRLTITLVHTHASEPVEVAIALDGGKANQVRRTVLTHTELNAHNTFDAPGMVVPHEEETDLSGAELVVTLPPASVTRLDVVLG